MTSIYSNNYYNDNDDWGFYVEMDDIPAPIYIISHSLPKRYTPITKPPSFTTLEEEVIIRPNKYNNYSTSFLRQISSINMIRNPVTKIATVISMLIISISSLLFNIEIVSDNEDN